VATGKLSRDHFIGLSSTGLLTITGGKWTTYKAMAEDVLLHVINSKLMHPEKIPMDTAVTFMGCAQTGKPAVSLTLPQGIHLYGDEESSVNSLPGAEHWLLPGFSEAMVRFAARYEFARTVEDVLARRSRWLFLDSKLALSVAAEVADILIDEGVSNAQLQEFQSLALKYLPAPLSSDPDNYETAVSSLPG
jgi:glycerol-3-phosphate dehydrogenase